MSKKREKHWWEDRIASLIEELFTEDLIVKGLELIQDRRVLDFMAGVEKVSARVEAEKTYRSEVVFTPYTDSEWELLLQRMSEESLFFGALLGGKFPAEIEQITAEIAHSIIPSAAELKLYCDCKQKRCGHLAGLLLRLNDKVNADPALLFQLRGRGREELLTAFRNQRHQHQTATKQTVVQSPRHQETTAEKFWGGELPALNLSMRADELPSAILKRVNPVLDLTDSAEAQLEEAYATIARRAQAWGLGLK